MINTSHEHSHAKSTFLEVIWEKDLMVENYDEREKCVCGFGEEYFVIENNQAMCTVCDCPVSKEALPADEFQETPSAEKKTVLIIDDRDSFRDKIAKMLSSRGFNTLDAPDGLSGVKVVNDLYRKKDTGIVSAIDVILLDLIMPGPLDGKGTLATIRTIAPQIPIIILTATPPKKELLKQLAEMGAQRYLNKTVSNLHGLLEKNIQTLLG